MSPANCNMAMVWKTIISIAVLASASACSDGGASFLPTAPSASNGDSEGLIGASGSASASFSAEETTASLFVSDTESSFRALVFNEGVAALAWNSPDENSAHEVYRFKFDDVHIQPSFENGRCQMADFNNTQRTNPLPAGFEYVGTVFGDRFMDNSVSAGGTYRYAVVNGNEGQAPTVVANDLDVYIPAATELESRSIQSVSTPTALRPASMHTSECINATPVKNVAIDKQMNSDERFVESTKLFEIVFSQPATPPEEVNEQQPVAQTWNGPLLAFPGATGYAKNATGGRGGESVVVNTLQDIVDPNDNLVSLREALAYMEFPRIITFSVGGLFDTGNDVIMMDESNSHATIACQTAPSPGVNIKGNGIRIHRGAENIVMRFCTLRNIDPGVPDSGASRAIGVVGTSGAVSNLVFDHLSISWATDENWTVFTGPSTKATSSNITLSNSIIAEGDADSSHYESGKLPNRYIHAMGPSCNSASDTYRIDGCSIINNLIAHNARRNPLMWGVSGEILNNRVYNWHESGLDARPHKNDLLEVYVVGNEFKEGPTTKANNNSVTLLGSEPKSKHLMRNNILVKYPSNETVNSPEKTSGQPSQPMSELQDFRMECVGASKPLRDAIDERIIAEYAAGTGGVGIASDHTRDYSIYSESSQWGDEHDRDGDGMADRWEELNGLDPNDRTDHASDPDGDGYTNIEEFINELAICQEAN